MSQQPETAAKAGRKVIITCAVTGSVHTPTMTPYLPITPDDIARESIAASEAGASIIHLHARNPKDGSPTPDPNVFMQFLPRIKQNCDSVINITTGGSLGMSMEDRLAAPLRAKPELCSLNMGSMNFGIYHVTDKITEWKYDWEKPYVERTRENVVSNSFAQIERFIRDLGEGCGTRFECECYDVGHLYTLAHFLDRILNSLRAGYFDFAKLDSGSWVYERQHCSFHRSITPEAIIHARFRLL